MNEMNNSNATEEKRIPGNEQEVKAAYNRAIEKYLEGYAPASSQTRTRPEQNGKLPAGETQSFSSARATDPAYPSRAKPTPSKKGKRLMKQPKKGRAAKQKAVRTGRTGKRIFVLLIAALLIGGSGYAVICHVLPQFNGKKAMTETVTQEMSQYIKYAETALSATPEIKGKTWASSGEALSDLVNTLNPGLPAAWAISYEPGNSYAEGKADPWGTPYYITAKVQDAFEKDDGKLYAFYITCAGENSIFDKTSMILDEDDRSELLLSLEDYFEMSGEHTFLEAGEDGYSSGPFPIVLEMGDGENGTAYLSVSTGETLPDIQVPELEGYSFTGYYQFPNGVGVRYYDAEGHGCVLSPFTEGTTLYAGWIETPNQQADDQSADDGNEAAEQNE